uniref:Uncharacterized protein n=1 Tax=Romanomermis culicivorax TaxID=13658 RepID=A0A915IBN1_ROMCU
MKKLRLDGVDVLAHDPFGPRFQSVTKKIKTVFSVVFFLYTTRTMYNNRRNFNAKGDGYEDNTKLGVGLMTRVMKIWNEMTTAN